MGPEIAHPPATPEFGHVLPGGPSHTYPSEGSERVTKLSVGTFDNNVYVVRCTGTGEALIVDGSAGPERVLPELEGFRATAILITHNHADHTTGLNALASELGIPVFAHPADAARIPVPTEPIEDGRAIEVGSLVLRVLHTPGHTAGAVCFLLGSHLFSGDTLFPGGPGATGGNPASFGQIMQSLETKLFTLPDETRVSPGHGLDTFISRERPYVKTWRARGW